MTKFFPRVTKPQARRLAPWAAVLLQMESGWMAFEFTQDYYRFRGMR